MQDEYDFLRRMLVHPDDPSVRSAYAASLGEPGDPRATFLRMDPTLERIGYVDWLERDGHLDYYLQKFPEVRREAEERTAKEQLRFQRRALRSALDPTWVAFMNTLGCPFEPFYFFSNHGDPRECRPDELPFAQRIGTRGMVVTFESDFRDEGSWDQGLIPDLHFLCQLKLDECAYGAATCPAHPFVCQLKTRRPSPNGADILGALHPRKFCSKYIRDLEATNIPYPGYHPGNGRGVENDEIHNDFAEQHIFHKQDEDHEEEVDEFDGAHGELKRFVVDGKLWYVLFHTTPEKVGDFLLSPYVILFAVGRSPHGERLVGVVTHQVCHNLCD